MAKPERELRGFVKTATLAPGQGATVTLQLTAADLASFDESASAWIAAEGLYTVRVGRASDVDGARATFSLAHRLVVAQSRPMLVPNVPVDELRITGH